MLLLMALNPEIIRTITSIWWVIEKLTRGHEVGWGDVEVRAYLRGIWVEMGNEYDQTKLYAILK